MDTVRPTSASTPPTSPSASNSPITIVSASSLLQTLGRASYPLVVDVRRKEAIAATPLLIAGATWRDPFEVNDWSKYMPRHRPVLVYCVHGFEISKNVADALRAQGVAAQLLEGGFAAWHAVGGPTTTMMETPRIPSAPHAPSVWVTRARPKIDRIACPWLIRRFIDPLAEFVYVPATEVTAYAESRGAIAYDVPNTRFTHRGPQCSFDALIEDFGLNDVALNALATIVRGADTDQLTLAPQSSGLLAVSLGLSQLYHDDHEMLAHGMVIYDALYAWLKSAQTEAHNAKLFENAS